MSGIITIKVENLDEIQKAFSRAPIKMVKEISIALTKITLKIESAAKKEAPVNKQSGGGNLRQSIRGYSSGFKGVVAVGANYAIYVHEGTRPHIIRVRTKKVLANKRMGQIFGKVVHHPGTKANPFLQRAVDKNKKFIDSQFAKAVSNAIK